MQKPCSSILLLIALSWRNNQLAHLKKQTILFKKNNHTIKYVVEAKAGYCV